MGSISCCDIDRDSLIGIKSVNVSKFKIGTKLKIETHNSTYLIEILEDGIAITGGTTRHGESRYPNPAHGHILGSSIYMGIPYTDRIEKGMCLVVEVEGKDLQTSPVKELTVIAPDESWNYCLGWRNYTD